MLHFQDFTRGFKDSQFSHPIHVFFLNTTDFLSAVILPDFLIFHVRSDNQPWAVAVDRVRLRPEWTLNAEMVNDEYVQPPAFSLLFFLPAPRFVVASRPTSLDVRNTMRAMGRLSFATWIAQDVSNAVFLYFELL